MSSWGFMLHAFDQLTTFPPWPTHIHSLPFHVSVAQCPTLCGPQKGSLHVQTAATPRPCALVCLRLLLLRSMLCLQTTSMLPCCPLVLLHTHSQHHAAVQALLYAACSALCLPRLWGLWFWGWWVGGAGFMKQLSLSCCFATCNTP